MERYDWTLDPRDRWRDPYERERARSGAPREEEIHRARERVSEGRRWAPDDERAPYREDGGGRRREIDPPWVEPGPAQRARGQSRGLYEWEDSGPLAWLGERLGGRRKGRGPKGYARSPDRIRDDVCERIARSGIDAGDVEVTVDERDVTLSGTVASRVEKWRLEDLADDVFGVEDVHNRLRVRRPEPERGTLASPARRLESERGSHGGPSPRLDDLRR